MEREDGEKEQKEGLELPRLIKTGNASRVWRFVRLSIEGEKNHLERNSRPINRSVFVYHSAHKSQSRLTTESRTSPTEPQEKIPGQRPHTPESPHHI